MSFKQQMSTTFRKSLLMGIPIATVVGLTALAYAVPNIFSSGQQLSSVKMNANFASLETEIGGPGVSPSLQAQVTALQNQVNALTAPRAPPLTYFWAGDANDGPVVAGFTVTPATDQYCGIVSSCSVPAPVIATGGSPTALEIDISTGGGAYAQCGFDVDVPFTTSSYSSAASTCYFQGDGTDSYTFQASITGMAGTSSDNIYCNILVQCP